MKDPDVKDPLPMAPRDDEPDLLAAALPALPIFPLPGTVFFPHTLLPLHVFEPRYRQMTEHVLAGHQHMAVVLLDATQGQAPLGVARVAGLGRVVHHERLPDGRFHILLQGVGRVAFEDELPLDGGRLYRRVRARPLADTGGDGIAAQLTTLRSCYARLLDAHPECKDTLGDLPLRLADAEVVSDLVCAALLDETPARQRALEETNLVARLKLANDALATLLLRTLPDDSTVLH
ncbi:MAG: ATP-dependent protease [Deltaproteobacteria bacterium]|nr:ATP-dependent protease [Deltaproteobacteria bacterium]